MTNKTFEELRDYTLLWARDKDLLHEENAEKQFMKFIEEVFEFKTEFDSVFRYRKFYRDNPHREIPKAEHERITKKAEMEMGDVFVTLIILCEQLGFIPNKCLAMAYDKNKDRKGKTINGTFVKDEDLSE